MAKSNVFTLVPHESVAGLVWNEAHTEVRVVSRRPPRRKRAPYPTNMTFPRIGRSAETKTTSLSTSNTRAACSKATILGTTPNAHESGVVGSRCRP